MDVVEINNTHTVSSAIEEYMELIGDYNTMHKSTFLLRGKWIWKDIRNNVLRSVSHKWVSVDKSKLPYRVTVPSGISLFLSVSIKNADGECVPLTPKQDMCIVDYVTVDTLTCGCKKELEQCIETSETTTETVTIGGTPYTKTTTKKVSSNGDVYTKVIQPTAIMNSTGSTVASVELIPIETLVCKLAVKECGCIEVSQENINILSSCCNGTTISTCNSIFNSCSELPYNELGTKNCDGYFKFDGEKTIFLQGSNFPSQVLVNGISNGEAEAEENIPDYAMQTFFIGMDYINSRYSKTNDRFKNRELSADYLKSKIELENNLPRNKINIIDWLNSTNKFAKW